jgi:hypothetical protein
MRGTVFFLETFHLSLRQRDGFGIFAGTAEFVDFGAERGDIAFFAPATAWRGTCPTTARDTLKISIDGGISCGLSLVTFAGLQ